MHADMLEGLNDLQRKLQNLENNARQLDGNHDVPLDELLNDDFVRRNTDFGTTDQMLDAYGGIDSGEDLQTPQWSDFVARRTRFDSWSSMLQAAGGEWATKKLGL